MPYIFSNPLPPSRLLDPMSQTMLLTKRLTTFLSQNTSPQLSTLLLLDHEGRLISSSSPLPTSTLRTMATNAFAMWTHYQQSLPSITSSLTDQPLYTNGSKGESGSALSSTTTATENENDVKQFIMQFSEGVMFVHMLACKALFVAVGPPTSSSSPYSNSHTLNAQAISNPSSPTLLLPAQSEGNEAGFREREMSRNSLRGMGGGAPSEVGSTASSATRNRGIIRIKRQAEEVGRWLNNQLEEFEFPSGELR